MNLRQPILQCSKILQHPFAASPMPHRASIDPSPKCSKQRWELNRAASSCTQVASCVSVGARNASHPHCLICFGISGRILHQTDLRTIRILWILLRCNGARMTDRPSKQVRARNVHASVCVRAPCNANSPREKKVSEAIRPDPGVPLCAPAEEVHPSRIPYFAL